MRWGFEPIRLRTRGLRLALLGPFLFQSTLVLGQEVQSPPPETTQPAPGESQGPERSQTAEITREPWIDRMQHGVYWTLWRSAMGIDRWFGSAADESEYQDLSGSIAPALLWDEFDGLRPKVRFRVNLPLPQFNERFDAFVGRVNREEYVTEREQESGALANQRGEPVDDDQTLVGIRYSEPEKRDRFTASGGVRVRTPLDPYVKASYRWQRGTLDTTLVSLRETAFWQNSEDFGFTSRVDVEGIWRERWLLRATTSGTISQQSEGVRGYSGVSALREFPNRRAAVAEIFASTELDADVPIKDYGIKIAYRRSISRDWLVLELRTGVTWPRDDPAQPREPSWALGVGLEMFFGTEEFVARPVTF